MRNSFYFLIPALCLIVSCTTTKSKSDITKRKRFYHNTTAYYNGYFHADEILDLALLDIVTQNEDNYTQILPLSPYTTNYDPTAYAKEMDRAIVKVSTVSALHEESQWVDDCYVLLGKAQFVKKDYESAEETFEYFKEEFDFSQYHIGKNKTNQKLSRADRAKARKTQEKERAAAKKEKDKVRAEESKVRDEEKKERTKSRKQELKDRKKAKKKSNKSRERAAENVKWTEPETKKDEDKPERKLLTEDEDEDSDKDNKKDEESTKKKSRHTPAYYEGLLWLAKTYSERERFSSAEYIFNALEEEPDAPKKVKQELPLSRARMYLVKKDYDKALEQLDVAIELEKDKKLKSRYSYVKAQILSRMGAAGEALKEYEKAKAYKPTFEMAYNAEINKILLRHQIGSTTADKAIKSLERMLKEEKYAIFKGQTHYALGQVKMTAGNREEALADFRKSIQYNQGNTAQQTESYYTLAKLFFEAEDYAESKYYYDSTLTVMNKSDFRYQEVDLYAKNLTSIAKNIQVMEKQDSLLTLSLLSDDELKDYAKEVLDSRGEEKAAEPQTSQRVTRGPAPRLNGSSFFAYNPISVDRGQRTFSNIWGSRQLADNWRTESDSDIEQSIREGAAEVVYTEQQLESVLRDIPKNDAQRELSRRKIQEAMFDLGKLYREKLQNFQAGFAMHKKLYDKYPSFDQKPELLYYLYLSAKDIGKSGQANKYKKELVNTYPETEFAKIISNPEYAKEIIEREKAPQKYYEQTYALFEKGKYAQVVERAVLSEAKLNGDKRLMAKMALVNAMATGKVKGKKDYIRSLEKLIKDYPNTEEERKATEIKRFLSGDETAFNEVLYNEDKQQFSKDFNKLHYGLIVVFKASSKVLNDMRIDMSKFHKQYFNLDQLSTQSIPLDQDNKVSLILVRSFDDKQKAMKYFDVIDAKDKEFIKKKGYSFEFFVINQNNYREVVKSKSINEYRIFFEDNYLDN